MQQRRAQGVSELKEGPKQSNYNLEIEQPLDEFK